MEKYNLQRAYKQVGEFGRAQKLIAFVTCMARNANNYYYYPFAYLVLEQRFECDMAGKGIFTPCSTEQICSSNTSSAAMSYRVDKSQEYFIQNWYVEMDLLCTAAPTIGLMLSVYFIGFALGGLAYSLPDRFGRKRCIFFGLSLSCFAQTVMLISNSFGVRTFMFFLMGLAQIKNSLSYVWLSECVSFRYKPTAFTMINIVDAIPMAIVCLSFLFLTKSWIWVCLLSTVLTYAATILTL